MASSKTAIDETLTTNTSTAVLDWKGSEGTFAAQGTWSSGTLQLEASFDGGANYMSVPGSEATMTADSIAGFTLGPCKLRATLSGASSPSLTVVIEKART